MNPIEEKPNVTSTTTSAQKSPASGDVLFNYIQERPSLRALPQLRKIVEDYNAKVVSSITLFCLIALGIIFLIPIFIDQLAILLPWHQFHHVFPFLSQTIFAQLRDKANFGWFLLYTIPGIIILSGTWAARVSFNKFRNNLRKRAAAMLQTRLVAEEQQRV